MKFVLVLLGLPAVVFPSGRLRGNTFGSVEPGATIVLDARPLSCQPLARACRSPDGILITTVERFGNRAVEGDHHLVKP